jgi:putative tryptophan/tyrosine transport system substrate-binding protein
MKRRSLLVAPALLPALAYAQQTLPLVGVLRVGSQKDEQFVDIFKRDMTRLGWDDGKNYRIQVAFAEGDQSRLASLSAELVRAGPRVLVPFGNTGVTAMQGATKELPIVGMSDDLVAWKLVASMARPGGNTTGVSILAHELDPKRLEVLHEIAPQARRVGVVFDEPFLLPLELDRLKEAAGKLGLEPVPVPLQSPNDFAPAMATLAGAKVDAVQFLASPMLNALRGRFIDEMTRLKLPAMHEWPETVEEGGLVSYGARIAQCFRHVAVLVNKVLKGAKPADLPVEQPTTFVLAVNTGAAKAIGLTIPEAVLLRADLVVD